MGNKRPYVHSIRQMFSEISVGRYVRRLCGLFFNTYSRFGRRRVIFWGKNSLIFFFFLCVIFILS